MLVLKNTKSIYRDWYQQNKQRLSEKRKKLYAENPEYRERALEASRRRRRGEGNPPTPADAPISFAQAAETLNIGASTLREWRRKNLFPEPRLHRGRLWFTENQASLLKKVKEFFSVYGKRPGKIKNDEKKRTRDAISRNWH